MFLVYVFILKLFKSHMYYCDMWPHTNVLHCLQQVQNAADFLNFKSLKGLAPHYLSDPPHSLRPGRPHNVGH